ncbi:MAG: GAF domain-containing protein [Bryobacterales bacterium]|nr:GAF domain-containing protein [Bryobacterales bacterium]
MKKYLLLAAVAVSVVWAQPKRTAFPFLRWFDASEYQGAHQVWSFAEDKRGLLYVGHHGLSEYDGTSWRSIPTPHDSSIRSMATDANGRVYVGETGDFGYLAPDAKGQMAFQSLLEHVPREDRNFQEIFDVVVSPEGIYFCANARLFRVTADGSGWRVKVWKPGKQFLRLLPVFGELYVMDLAGAFRLRADRLEPFAIPGLSFDDVNQRPVTLLPFDPRTRQMLLATRGGKLYLFNGADLSAFPNEAADLLVKLGIARGVMLPDGAVGIATRFAGFFVLERNGRIRHYIDRAAGVPSDGAITAYVDKAGSVWLGLQNGIAKVETVSPFTQYPDFAAVNEIKEHLGALYVATLRGVLFLGAGAGEFRTVAGTEVHSIFGLLSRGDSLLMAGGASASVLQLRGSSLKEAIPVVRGLNVFTLQQSRVHADRVWLGTSLGLASIREVAPGNWVYEGIRAATPIVRSIVETEPGVLWMGTQSQGVVRVQFSGDSLENPKMERFGQADGLPYDGGFSVNWAAGRLVFVSQKGVREFDPTSRRFVESKIFGSLPTGGSAEELNIVADGAGNLWTNLGVRPILLQRQSDGSYKADVRRLQRLTDGAGKWIHLDTDGILWIGSQDRVFRYDPRIQPPAAAGFPTLIRRVTSGETEKTTLYAGGGGAAATQAPAIPYAGNALRFEYAAASFEDPSKNQFRSMLEGFDHEWSAWTSETRRDYTNLPPGDYRFRVKARNSLLQESAEGAEYRFFVLAPWYRTWWAYGSYVLLILGAIFAGDRLQRRRLLAKERATSEARMIQSELERKRNIELLSEIGKEITSSLDMDTIFAKLYTNVNQLMDATIFGVGIYLPEEHAIEYRLAFEKGKRYEPYRRDTRDKNQFPVWCIENRKPVVVNDVDTESSRYIPNYQRLQGYKLEDGSESQPPQSLLYLPLIAKNRVLGIITVQSFEKKAYTDYHLNLLENLAAYTSIAIDNADAYQHLKSAQEQLVVQEKLASLGALTAGIAHEIKNPLNFVNNFADLSVELTSDLREEMEKLKSGAAPDMENINALLSDLAGNAKKINEHGRRADGIVKSMLLHSRGQAGERQPTDINGMLDEYTNLAYHGMRAQDSTFNITIQRQFAPDLGKVDAVPQDLSRVFLNILNNACYAAHDKAKRAGTGYSPTLQIRTVNLGDAIEVRIRDNGMGIPQDVREKIFNPFFTTKPTGQGTGLGLSISHDIVVQQHRGQLEVETEPGQFTEFIVRLPRQGRIAA